MWALPQMESLDLQLVVDSRRVHARPHILARLQFRISTDNNYSRNRE